MIKMTKKLEELMQELKKTSAETFYHCLRTKRYVNQMLMMMNDENETAFSPEEIDSICKGAMLHDLGKLNVENFVLTKDASLTSEEKADIKKHTHYGWDIIKDEMDDNERDTICNICLYHHERIDGNGYEGKTDLPLYVQIVSVCDAFDAMHSDRIYREGCSAEKTLEIIKNGGCGAFDGKLIGFMERIAEGLEEQ